MGLGVKVRVADLVQAQRPVVRTSNDGLSSKRSGTDILALRFQEEEVDRVGDIHDLDGKGVLYCELNPEDGFSEETGAAAAKKNDTNSSVPRMTTKEEP